MRAGWIIGFVMAFVIMSIIACVCEMDYLGEGEISHLQQLMQPDFPDYKIPIIGPVAAFISVAWDYIRILWGMFWFDYPFFEGSFAIVRYILFIPISIGVIVSLVLATFRGVSS